MAACEQIDDGRKCLRSAGHDGRCKFRGLRSSKQLQRARALLLAPDKAKRGPVSIGPGYVFEAEPSDGYLRISAAGTFNRETVEWIRDALNEWLGRNPPRPS